MVFFHAACGDGRRADAQTARVGRRRRVIRNTVVVGHDAGPVQRLGELLAGDVLVSQIDQNQVVVRSAGHELEAIFQQFFGQGLGVPDDLFCIGDEFGRIRLGQRHGHGGHRVHVRPTLQAREDGPVHGRGVLGPAQQHTAARAAQRLVRGGRDDVRIRHGAVMDASDDQARDVGNIADVVGADVLGDLPENLEINLPRIRGCAGDDDFRPVLFGKLGEVVVVNPAGFGVDRVGDGFEEPARERDLASVGKMPAVDVRHSHDGIARLDQSRVCGQVRDRAGVRLNVRVVGLEQFLRALLGHFLDQVGHLLALVVSPPRVAFGVLVGQASAAGQHDGPGNVVLRRDQADGPALARLLLAHQFINLRIVLFKCVGHILFSGKLPPFE